MISSTAAFQKLRESICLPSKPNLHQSTSINGQISLSHAIRVKSAEYWMRLGEADQALKELKTLPKSTWNHPWAVEVVKARVAAVEALRERTEAIVQE